MPRKSSSAAVAVTVAATVDPLPPVVARKRARRAAASPAPEPPPPPAVTIDLAAMTAENAKRALAAAFPRHVEGKRVAATEETTFAALEYLNARDAETIAQGRKEAAGNVLRLAMGDAEAVDGDGWEATWRTQKGDIDWGAIVKELAIPSETIERFRKPLRRVLNVREKAK